MAPLGSVLLLASKSTLWSTAGSLGVNVNAGVKSIGGRITPGGTRRIDTDRGAELPKPSPTGVATIETTVPSSTPSAGLGGAVYITVAWPSPFVTTLCAE